jgi:hypothetical protein
MPMNLMMRSNRSLLLLSAGLLAASCLDGIYTREYGGLFGDRRDIVHVLLLLIGSMAIVLCWLKDFGLWAIQRLTR